MRKGWSTSWFQSPLNLPEGKSGKVSITHRIIPAGEEVPVVGMRQAVLRGIRPVVARPTEPLRVHQLVHEERGMWMTDLPEELNQIGELMFTVAPQGRVLVGGLGLGILAHACATRLGVDQVVVVEIDPDVIKLCKGFGYDVVQADIAEFLRTTDERFDYYLLDTWQATNESAWWREVMPLRRIIRQRQGKAGVIHCWAEDIMLGQIMRSLTTKPPHWFYTGLPVPMSQQVADRFVRDVGLPGWEKKYGAIVDQNTKAEAA